MYVYVIYSLFERTSSCKMWLLILLDVLFIHSNCRITLCKERFSVKTTTVVKIKVVYVILKKTSQLLYSHKTSWCDSYIIIINRVLYLVAGSYMHLILLGRKGTITFLRQLWQEFYNVFFPCAPDNSVVFKLKL